MAPMEFLSVFRIKQLAYRKGYAAERAVTVKGRSFVKLRDPKGKLVPCSDLATDFSLSAAKRLLQEQPDRPAKPSKARTRSSKPRVPTRVRQRLRG